MLADLPVWIPKEVYAFFYQKDGHHLRVALSQKNLNCRIFWNSFKKKVERNSYIYFLYSLDLSFFRSLQYEKINREKRINELKQIIKNADSLRNLLKRDDRNDVNRGIFDYGYEHYWGDLNFRNEFFDDYDPETYDIPMENIRFNEVINKAKNARDERFNDITALSRIRLKAIKELFSIKKKGGVPRKESVFCMMFYGEIQCIVEKPKGIITECMNIVYPKPDGKWEVSEISRIVNRVHKT